MRIIVGVTGAIGVEITWDLESDIPMEKLFELADYVHDEHNMAASVSSGSFVTDGMIVMPCSMKTLAGIAAGYAENLIVRAVDVCMKEGRKVVLVPREMPMGKVHLRNMKEAAYLYVCEKCLVVMSRLLCYHNIGRLEKSVQTLLEKSLMRDKIENRLVSGIER